MDIEEIGEEILIKLDEVIAKEIGEEILLKLDEIIAILEEIREGEKSK